MKVSTEVDLTAGARIKAVREANQQVRAIVLLKGARTAIANPQGQKSFVLLEACFGF